MGRRILLIAMAVFCNLTGIMYADNDALMRFAGNIHQFIICKIAMNLQHI